MGSPVGQEVRLQLKPQLDCTVESERLLRPTLHMARQPQPRDDGCSEFGALWPPCAKHQKMEDLAN